MSEHAELFSPVLIGTCNRINHFKALIESLQDCYWVADTELYIAIDAPYVNEVYEVNQEIKTYSKNITGFAKVHIIDRPYNFGPVNNFSQAIDEIFQQHETLILLEDDNTVAKNFLVYMNKALRAFENDPKCFAICGYNFTSEPIEEPSNTDVYAAPYQSALGVGYWKAKYSHPDLTAGERPELYFLNPFHFIESHYYVPHLFPMYIGSYLSGEIFGDVMMCINVLKSNSYCIYPRTTKVINNGFDGSGVHCSDTKDIYHDKFMDEKQTEFNFVINTKTNRSFFKKNNFYFNKVIPIRFHMRLYAFAIYALSAVFGRTATIQLRDLVKHCRRQ